MSEILFLAHRTPWPPDRGDRIRSHHILKALTELAPVHLGCFGEGEPPLALASAHIEPLTRSKPAAAAQGLARRRPLSLALTDSATMHGWVKRTLATRPISCVFAFSGQMAQFVPASVPRFVMDFVDVDSAKFELYAETASWPQRAVYAREARKLTAFERQTARRADLSLFVSEAEAALFRRRSGAGNAIALGNGVDLDYFDPRRVMPIDKKGALIVFTGQMDYPPNIEAVTAFATEALPLIRDYVPEARFAIVGRNPTAAVLGLARWPGVTVTGEVADVRPWLAAASIVVAPLTLARGVQNKVLEAMAMARPVVASPAAFEGIDAEPGRDLLVAEPGEAKAETIVRLLAEPARAAALGQAARRQMIARYSWAARLADLARIVGLERLDRAA